MTLPEPRFPDYGDGGDEIGARRSRRAFRRSVAAVILLSAMLFVSENYLRYEQTERLFRLGVSFPVSEFPSARTVLRAAVKQDAALHGTPNAKYYEALAEREEDDRILPAYAKAHELDPSNAFLAIRYGCALAKQGQTSQALDIFRKAAERDPHNALSAYLQAAVTPLSSNGKDSPEESLALVARANSSGNPVVFPRPLWVSSFPVDGACYQDLRRNAIRECCAPLLEYAKNVGALAESQIRRGQPQNWDAWLNTLQEMGDRLATGDPGTLQVKTGLEIEARAIRLREQLRQSEKSTEDKSLPTLLTQVQAALDTVDTFEAQRAGTIQQDRARFEAPKWLWIESFCLLFMIYFLSVTLARLSRASAMHWTVAHRRAGWAVPAFGCVVCILLLAVEPWLGKLAPDKLDWISDTWWGGMAVMVAFGLYYPVYRLKSSKAVCESLNVQLGYETHLTQAVDA
ncbi:MAG: hypothetical protein HZB26_21790 [Candidatus Hydrogenedentes bacterium]|nr:hypothetical protein [Candidatus Hydrogenedentota bacterium]